MGLDYGGGHGFIRRLRIEQAGNVLSDCQNYNKLMSAIVLPSQGGIDSVAHRSLTEGLRFANRGAAANINTAALAAEMSGAAVNTPTNADTGANSTQKEPYESSWSGRDKTYEECWHASKHNNRREKMNPVHLVCHRPNKQ